MVFCGGALRPVACARADGSKERLFHFGLPGAHAPGYFLPSLRDWFRSRNPRSLDCGLPCLRSQPVALRSG